ncbi:hypothetical protein JD844_021528 [Phrynosoma platyrhinos]|uniref:Tetraspanin n=1 Tax=Phrynosoma platyrhinos TaxID=52577 RepID=A0ABQ7STN0_PHRPL|nr:hypothetical protein JD844_021528 [Phrynosoma platyrhinos]
MTKANKAKYVLGALMAWLRADRRRIEAACLILGAVILGFGIWILVDKSSFISVLQTSSYSLKVGAYILIGVGSVTMLMGFLGCVGAVNEIRCLLGLYFTCLLLILIAQVAAGLLIYFQRNALKAEMSGIVGNLIQNYNPYDESNRNLETAWDYVQTQESCKSRAFGLAFMVGELQKQTWWVTSCAGLAQIFVKDGKHCRTAGIAESGKVGYSNLSMSELSCCGWSGPGNWKNNTVLQEKNQTSYPCSCSNDSVDSVAEVGFCPLETASNNTTFEDWPVRKQGCMKGVQNWLQENLGIILGVCTGVAVIELLGMVLSICLCKNIHTEEYTKVPKY